MSLLDELLADNKGPMYKEKWEKVVNRAFDMGKQELVKLLEEWLATNGMTHTRDLRKRTRSALNG